MEREYAYNNFEDEYWYEAVLRHWRLSILEAGSKRDLVYLLTSSHSLDESLYYLKFRAANKSYFRRQFIAEDFLGVLNWAAIRFILRRLDGKDFYYDRKSKSQSTLYLIVFYWKLWILNLHLRFMYVCGTCILLRSGFCRKYRCYLSRK